MTEPAVAAPATLLLVDDEANILSSLRRLFRPEGYRILTAESGPEGLELIAAERVDLVISDMRMPGMDGAAFLAHVRERSPDSVRILLTGYADINATVSAINEGEIYRYVAKPWDDRDMLLMVRDVLQRRALERENAALAALTRRQNEELQAANSSLERKVAERSPDLCQRPGRVQAQFRFFVDRPAQGDRLLLQCGRGGKPGINILHPHQGDPRGRRGGDHQGGESHCDGWESIHRRAERWNMRRRMSIPDHKSLSQEADGLQADSDPIDRPGGKTARLT